MNTDEKKDVKISIIIPVYNGEATIGACLESALRQTLKEIEIIVYDDCSADSTWEIISEYAEKDSRIIAIRYAENRTASKARKDGVLRARGEYILFLDADDRYADNACAELYGFKNLRRPISASLRVRIFCNIALRRISTASIYGTKFIGRSFVKRRTAVSETSRFQRRRICTRII